MHKLRTPKHNAVSASAYQADHLGTSRLPIATGGPVLTIDLPASVLELQREGTLSGNRNAFTLVKHRDFRLVLSLMKAGTKLARHNVQGTVLIHVLSVHIRTEIFDASLHATAGQIISLDPNMEHEVNRHRGYGVTHHNCVAAGQQLATSGHQYASDRAAGPSYDWRADESVWE